MVTRTRLDVNVYTYVVLHACTPRPRRDILGHPCFAWLIVIFNICIRLLLVLYHTLPSEPRPVSHASLAVGLSA